MTNVFKFGRKVLTMGTVFSTILWSVGVSALVPAMAQAQTSCPAFQPGDMIKVTGRPAIYSVDANGRVLYFPSGDEFKSWNAGETYGGYTTVSQSCFDSLPVPTSAPLGVNFRPGSYVVKRPSSDQLYVVEPNNTLATITSAAAASLYGASYKVKTVADVFWPNYGNVRGTAVTEAKAHPGMLVSNGGKTYFVDSTGALREVTAAGFTANRFKQAFVHPIASTAGYTVGTQLTAFESAATDRTQTGVTGGSTPVSSGAVTVSLASDNPAGGILASNTAFNPVLKLNLTAGSQSVSITGLTVRKTGFAANTAVSGVEVVDSSGVRHGNISTSLTSENDATVLFSGSPIVVAANSTQTVTVRVNVAASGTSGTLQFSVVGAASVQGATAGGSFPVAGNVFTLQDGSNSVASTTIALQSVSGASGTTLNVDSANEQDITKFRIAETQSKENIRFSKLTLYNNGTTSDSDVADVQLVAQDGSVLATAQQIGKVVTFNLVTPYVIDKGTSKDFTVRTKIVNGSGRYIQFTIFNDYDVVITGANTGATVIPAATGSADTTFPLGDSSTYNRVTIGSGSVSFNKDSSSPSAAITPSSNNVVLAKFFVKPTGEDMELRQIALAVVSSSAMYSGSITVKVNGASVYSAAPSAISTVGTTLTTTTLSTYPTLTAGQNSYITVEASNIISGAANSATTSVTLNLAQVRRLITNDIYTPNTNPISGNTLSVQSGAVKVTTMATPVATSLVAGSSNVALANFEINAGTVSSGEDIRVNKLIVSDTVAASGVVTDIGNLVMYDSAGNALATSASTAVNAASTTFTFVNPIIVPKNGSVSLALKGDVLTGTQGTHTFKIAIKADVTATGVTTGNAIEGNSLTLSGNGQAMTIASAGTLSVSAVTGATAAPSSDQAVVVGTTNVPVFAFKLAAQKEGIKVTSLTLTATGTLNVNDVQNLKLFKDNDTSPFATAGQMVSSAVGLTYTFSAADNLLASAVKPGTPVTVYVKADIGGAGAAKLGDSFKFSIASTTTDLVGKGESSGTTAVVSGAAAVTALTYVTPFNVSVAAAYPTSDVNANLATGSRIGSFKITNNGGAQITVTSIKVTDLTGSTHSPTTYSLKVSSQNSTDFATTNLGALTLGTASTTSAVTIDGGAYKYFSVYILSSASTTDSYQLSISAVGDVKYTAAETDLGYDANIDGSFSTTADKTVFEAVASDKATAGQISDTTSA